jgi:cytochrome c oxidase subunit 3
MSAHTVSDPATPTIFEEDPVAARNRMLLGVRMGIGSEVMLFAALFAAYFVIRSDSPSWPPSGLERPELLLPALNTILLVSSSVTMQIAVWAMERDERPRSLRWMAITLLLGALFLGIQGYEFATNGFGLRDGVFGSTFYTITGFHGAHVLAGLLLIAIVANRARRGLVTGQRHTAVEAVSYYWHFVDAVWLFLFATLYVL